MFEIKPIQNKTEQENYCNRCHAVYDADCMAYGAFVEDKFSGICQFHIRNGEGYIKDLVPAMDVDDFEVMFIMGRVAMNFIDLCGVHICKCRRGAGDSRLITAIGFKDTGDTDLFADMTGMFDGSHCSSKEKE